MSRDRLEECGFCVGKELVVLTRLCCGSLGRKCGRTCDMERPWKLSELCSLSPACKLQHVVLPWLLKPQVSRACLHQALPGIHPRLLWLRPGAMPLQEQSIAEHSHSLTCCRLPLLVPVSLSHCGQGKVKILSGCFPSWALPFCLLNMYPSSLLPVGASLSFPVLLCNAWGWSHK